MKSQSAESTNPTAAPGRRASRWIAAIPSLLVALALGAAPASAQGGWLGLSLDFEDDTGPTGERQTVIVVGVAEDSPAERAGVLENDVLLEIRGETASDEALEDLIRTVDPGDAVELVLLRGDERIPLIVEAGERPPRAERVQVIVSPDRADRARMEFTIRLDSIREAVEVLNRERIDRVRVRVDSLREELQRGALDMREFEEAMERAEVARAQALAELSGRLSILSDSIGSIEIIRGYTDWDPAELDASVRRFMIPDFDVVVPDFDADWGDAVITWGGATPFIVGQRVVAGAELVDLNQSLARYFEVDGGALVVDVSERSPAGEAGVEAGDVIVEVNGEPVDGVGEVRERFARLSFSPFFQPGAEPDEPITITVMRGAERMEIELRE